MVLITSVAVNEMILELATSFWERWRSFLMLTLSCRVLESESWGGTSQVTIPEEETRTTTRTCRRQRNAGKRGVVEAYAMKKPR